MSCDDISPTDHSFKPIYKRFHDDVIAIGIHSDEDVKLISITLPQHH